MKNYEYLSWKNKKLLKYLSSFGDARLTLDNSDPKLKGYKEADIYDLIDCGYFKCELPKGHGRTQEDNWRFVGFLTHKGFNYNWGRFNYYIKSIGSLGGWLAIIEAIFSLLNV